MTNSTHKSAKAFFSVAFIVGVSALPLLCGTTGCSSERPETVAPSANEAAGAQNPNVALITNGVSGVEPNQ